jgi:GNAT superfamily N-acetyltransferase
MGWNPESDMDLEILGKGGAELDPSYPTSMVTPTASLPRAETSGPRVAVAADIPALVRVINRAYVVENTFVAGDRTSKEQVRERLEAPHAVFLVVDDPSAPGELAAGVWVEIRGQRGYFGMLAVDPRHQGSGLGRRLVVASEDYCRAAGCRFLDISIVNVRRELPAFYAKFGFAPYDTGPFHSIAPVTRRVHVVRMTKPLVPLW